MISSIFVRSRVSREQGSGVSGRDRIRSKRLGVLAGESGESSGRLC